LADGMKIYFDDLEQYLVKECGHWTQQKKPEGVNKVILDWLTRTFSL
jgi:pimeloyl-ACP methyl ester carboxylesterase